MTCSNINVIFRFIEEIDRHQLKNPLVFVTKKTVPIAFQNAIRQLKRSNILFCLSYSGLSGNIERGVNIHEIKANFESLHDNKLKVIHFWRPIIKQNGTLEKISEMLKFVSRYAVASVYVGLKLHPKLAETYETCDLLTIPRELSNFFGDYIPSDVEEIILSTARLRYPDYPLYKHTSCAVSLALGIADYNATRYRKNICIKSTCPAFHRIECEKGSMPPTRFKVCNLLNKIGIRPDFDLYRDRVEINSEVNQEDYAFLLHQINFPIVARNISFNRLLHGSIFRRDNDPYVLRGYPKCS